MQIGVSVKSAHGVDDPRDGARRMVDRAEAAERAGLASLFVGDHHATGPFPYFQNSPMLGRLLAAWGDRLAGALYLLPLWHPVLLAEQLGTLAALARGPFALQCAVGAGEQQFAAMGVPLATRAASFEAVLDAVKALLVGEEVSGVVGPWELSGARVAPLPPAPIEVWIGGHAAPAVDRAARMGDVWLAGPDAVPDTAAELLRTYLDACERHGTTPRPAIRRDVYVGEDEADARATAQPVVDAGYRGFDPRAPIFGSVDQVAERLRELAAIGYEHVLVRNLTEDPARAVACLERLGEVRRLVADA